ncbi:MAG: ferredoxin [Nitrospirae bacterium GWC2_56_14]|jgi:NAD-dependent dihydropyrimidine dehydrogenase PreA subunit|nr:MAG: ferredoxin [Nitrospirae bacterium GWC2_56_14]
MKYLANVSTLQFFSDKCTGCGRCVEVCPHGVFEMRDKRANLIDRDRCMECGACAKNCEFNAITVNTGVGCAAAIINSLIYGGAPSCDCSGTGSSCCG